MARRKQLKSKTERLYYSGFCLTDNMNFALFNVSAEKLKANGIEKTVPFEFSENDFDLRTDKSQSVISSYSGKIVTKFGEYGTVKTKYVKMFPEDCIFCPVTEWFGKPTNRLLMVFHRESFKPLGVLKTIVKEK